MRLQVPLTILLAVVVIVYGHPALVLENDIETLQGVDVTAGVDKDINAVRQTRGFCCGGGRPYGGGYGFRRPYGGGFGRPYGGGGGGGFGGSFSSAQASSSSFGGGFGYGK